MGALLNRARMTTATTGTGTITLGSASNGFASFAEAGATNATAYSYCIEDGNDFEIGVGTYTSSGTTFSRDTVTLSKIGGTAGTTKLTLSGSATIFITARAQEIATLDAAQTYSATQTITPAANTSALVSSGGSLTGANAQSLISLAQTWNTSGTPTAIDLNITDTASNAASLLLNLRSSGTSQFRVSKSGVVEVPSAGQFSDSVGALFRLSTLGLCFGSSQYMSFSNGNTNVPDLSLFRDAANTLAQRNGTNAQTFRVYNTFTDASNYERGFAQWSGNVFQIGAQAAGTGTARTLELIVAGSARLSIATDGGVTVGGYIQTPTIADSNNTQWRLDSAGLGLGDDNTVRWSSVGSPNGTADSLLHRAAAGVIGVRGVNTSSGGALEFIEQTAPAAGATNTARLFSRDNGSGKTQLCVIFNTGAIQVLATEP